MNKANSALKVVEKVGSFVVKQDFFRWPPPCMGILHQPKRPKTKCDSVKDH